MVPGAPAASEHEAASGDDASRAEVETLVGGEDDAAKKINGDDDADEVSEHVEAVGEEEGVEGSDEEDAEAGGAEITPAEAEAAPEAPAVVSPKKLSAGKLLQPTTSMQASSTKQGVAAEDGDEADDDDDDFGAFYGFGGFGRMGAPEDATAQNFDMRLGELPSELTVLDESGAPLPNPKLEQDLSSKMYHLVIPAGGYVRVSPTLAPQGGYTHHLYWTVQFDAQWTVTGEGGGFALLTPWDQIEEGKVPFFVGHSDGAVTGDQPPKTAPEVQVTIESEDPTEVAAAKKEAVQQRIDAAVDKSKQWQRVTVTGSYGDDTVRIYVDGTEVVVKGIYFSSCEYPCLTSGGFYLFGCSNSDLRPQHEVRLRSVTVRSNTMDKDAIFTDSEHVNDDLPLERIESIRYERAMRRSLYVPQLPGRKKKAARQHRLLTSLEPPAIWNHAVTHALFDVPADNSRWSADTWYALTDDLADFVDMVNLMVEKSTRMDPKVERAYRDAIQMVRESVREERPRGRGGYEAMMSAAAGKGPQISEWEKNQRRALAELEKLQKVDDGKVHVVALKRPSLRFLVLARKGATWSLTLISTSRLALDFHPQRAMGQRLMFNACLALSGIPAERMQNELWWTLLFMIGDRTSDDGAAKHLYQSVLPWLVKRPLEDIESSAEGEQQLGDQVGAQWRPMPKESPNRHLPTVSEVIRYLMERDGTLSRQQVDDFFFQLRMHLVVACSTDLSFFPPSSSPLEQKEVDILSHVSKSIAVEATQHKQHSPSTLHQLQQALSTLQAELSEHINTRRPKPPALLQLMPERRLKQQHLHWGFDTCISRDTSEQAGTSSFDKQLSGLKAVSFFPSALQQLHGVPASADDSPPSLDFSACLRTLQSCLELCLQLSNLEDVKWRCHLTCAALADTFLKQLPLPLPPSQSLDCVWANASQNGNATATVAHVLELLRRLTELLAFASGSGSISGDDAAAWHPSLVCISGAAAAIADAVARSGAGGPSSTRLADLLCGKLGRLRGEPEMTGEHSGGESRYGIGVGAFELRTSTLLLTPALSLVRKHVLEYFQGLRVPSSNELFDVEDAEHYVDDACATRRFFKALTENIYCHEGSSGGICDLTQDLLHVSGGATAWRDVMTFWKVFVLTCDTSAPFDVSTRSPGGSATSWSLRKHYCLVWQHREIKDRESGPEYTVMIEAVEKENRSYAIFFDSSSNFPVRAVERTASDPTYHTAPHSLLTEDDVLHLRRLPDFDGRLRQPAAELLLQYLTVPYLRIPLVLDFFAEDTIYALQSEKLQELVERVLFEPGAFRLGAAEAPTEVPCAARETVTATAFGLLMNELVHCGARTLASITALLKLALKYDAYRADDSMSAVILFIARLAVRIEAAATVVLTSERLASHDRPLLEPRDPHSLLTRLIELRVLMRQTVAPVLLTWLSGLEEERGADAAKTESLQCNVHAHLLYLHSNLQPFQLSKGVVSQMLSSFMHVMHGYSGATVLHVPLTTLFQIMHELRASLIGWLESDTRRSVELHEVLSEVYQSALGQAFDDEHAWGKFRELQNRGRYAMLRRADAEADATLRAPLVNEQDESTVAELNLQVMQVAAAGAVIKPLPAALKDNSDVKEVLASFGALQAAVEDVRQHVTRYNVVGRGVWLELWDGDSGLELLTELNRKEKSKMMKRLKGEEIGDEFELQEEHARWVTSMGTLVRDAARTQYTRKLDYKLSLAADKRGVGDRLGARVGDRLGGRGSEVTLQEHERWVYDVMDSAGLAFKGFAGAGDFAGGGAFRGFGFQAGARGQKGADSKDKLFDKVVFYLPDVIDPAADVVKLVGGPEASEVLQLDGDKTRGRQMFTFAGRYTACAFEAYVHRLQNLVHGVPPSLDPTASSCCHRAAPALAAPYRRSPNGRRIDAPARSLPVRVTRPRVLPHPRLHVRLGARARAAAQGARRRGAVARDVRIPERRVPREAGTQGAREAGRGRLHARKAERQRGARAARRAVVRHHADPSEA